MPRPSGTQTRSFAYNGKQLLKATNPENGTVTYTYNSNNQVATKTDAKGQAFSYAYVGPNRLATVSIGGNQIESYTYDTTQNSSYPNYSQGRLTAISYGGFVETYGYNPAGQKTNKGLKVTQGVMQTGDGGNTYSGQATADLESVYNYDNQGSLISIQYPSGLTLSYTYDAMERLNTLTNTTNSATIITGATYDPGNRLLSLSGNLTESRTYNVMGQLTQLSSSATSGPSINYAYGYSSTQNNGKIASQTDNITGEDVVYTYDALNRLATAVATSNAWGQSYTYDGFGNLLGQTVTEGTAPSLSVSYNASSNLQTTDCADANGNITGSQAGGSCSSGQLYTYDAKNRIASATVGGATTRYAYAPNNKRVWRGAPGTQQVVLIGSSGAQPLNEVTFWSVTGQKLQTCNIQATAYAVGGSVSFGCNGGTNNVYFGKKLISNSTGNVAQDRLGSIGKFYPWGQEKPSATTNGTEKFTAYFRDAETGNDYAVNRYHQPGMGRFLSTDPDGGSARSGNPGSWNRYAYVAGDPVNRVDRTGLDGGDFVAQGGLDDCDADFCDSVYDGSGDGSTSISEDYCSLNPDDPDCFDPPPYVPPPPAPTPPPPPPPTCSITLYDRPVGGIGQHTYLSISDPALGINDILEGGPTHKPKIPNPVGGNWGNLFGWISGSSGANRGSPLKGDNPATNNVAASETGGAATCAEVVQLLSDVEQYDTSAYSSVSYRPLPTQSSGTYNSNSFTYTLLTLIGLNFPEPSGWNPGWGLTVPGLVNP
jgi:RHS repeat-associated protein